MIYRIEHDCLFFHFLNFIFFGSVCQKIVIKKGDFKPLTYSRIYIDLFCIVSHSAAVKTFLTYLTRSSGSSISSSSSEMENNIESY